MNHTARIKGAGGWEVSRRQFMHMAGAAALALLVSGCQRAASPNLPSPLHTGWIDTKRYRKNGPWKLGRSGRGDMTAWMVMFSAHIEYGVKEKYCQLFSDYFCTSANWDPNKQIEDIKILLAERIDLLLIDPLDQAVVKAGVEEAMQAGVPVILASTRVQSDQYVSWVTLDEEERGVACAEWVCRTAPAGRIVVVSSVPAAGDSAAWLRGVHRRLDDQPGMPPATVLQSAWSSSAAKQVLTPVLREAGPVDGVIVNNGLLGQGVVEAFAEHGPTIPPIAGGDDCNGWLRTAIAHNVRFLGLSGGANLGLRCVELATQVLAGQPAPGYVEFPYETFDEGLLYRYHRPDLSDHYWAVNDLPQAWIERMFKL